MEKVYIGIGSNIKPKENIKKVKNKIEKYFHCNFSETYKYKSAGFEGYDFLNLVACFFTDLSPMPPPGNETYPQFTSSKRIQKIIPDHHSPSHHHIQLSPDVLKIVMECF